MTLDPFHELTKTLNRILEQHDMLANTTHVLIRDSDDHGDQLADHDIDINELYGFVRGMLERIEVLEAQNELAWNVVAAMSAAIEQIARRPAVWG